MQCAASAKLSTAFSYAFNSLSGRETWSQDLATAGPLHVADLSVVAHVVFLFVQLVYAVAGSDTYTRALGKVSFLLSA
jgi:hypothetical protein